MQNWQEEFAARFARHADELKWLYMELYHNDQQAWDYFTGMIYRAWEARPESLRMIDRAREACPEWYRGHDLVGKDEDAWLLSNELKKRGVSGSPGRYRV